jgi:hypothetical protein
LHVLPTSAGRPSRRSVITYDMAADLLINLAEMPIPGSPLFAADPLDFDLVALAKKLRSELDRRVVIISLPLMAVRAVERLAPRLGNRLFRSSILNPAINIAAGRADRSAERELSLYLERLRSPTVDDAGAPHA